MSLDSFTGEDERGAASEILLLILVPDFGISIPTVE
jgi:hypothetical protein